jgi:D-tyrosyl-tRNA(Tyr) deacylase
MRALIQRVVDARVEVAGATVGVIGPGLAAFVGVTHADTPATADRLADKIWNLRVFADTDGAMNRSLADLASGACPAEVLVVSQFTLYGDTRKGRRPSWVDAARPEHAEPLVARLGSRLGELGATVATGRFRTHMQVTLTNDGPVTLMLEV